MKRFALQMLVVSVVSFSLHYVWEQLHIPLYTSYEGLTVMPIALYATSGDVLYTLGAILLIGLFKRRLQWIEDVEVSDLIGLAVVGFVIALLVEYKALALMRWAYTDAMPIIPFLHVGLTPILQMTLLLPFSIRIARHFRVIL